VTGEGEPDWWGRRVGENIDVFIFVVKLINGIFGPAMSLLMLFRGEVPRRWRELKAEGLEVRSLAEGLPEIGGKFVVVVGDRELAERLRVAYMSEEEAEEFFRYLKEALSRVSSA
jgi:hypothetical protein